MKFFACLILALAFATAGCEDGDGNRTTPDETCAADDWQCLEDCWGECIGNWSECVDNGNDMAWCDAGQDACTIMGGCSNGPY